MIGCGSNPVIDRDEGSRIVLWFDLLQSTLNFENTCMVLPILNQRISTFHKIGLACC